MLQGQPMRPLAPLLLLIGLRVCSCAPAAAPAALVALAPGSLAASARNPPSGTAVCQFRVQGGPSSSSATSSGSSSRSASVGAGLTRADIKCSGSSSNITIQGGPALESYVSGWEGVSYIKNVQLPGSTMTLRGVSMVVEDSSFVGLQSFGSAAIAFAASNVTFLNTTFLLNNNSAAGCIYANESSSIAILDSNFTNNAGLAAGSVALWNSSVIVNNTLFRNNTCNAQGGALMTSSAGTVTISQSTFAANNATNGGALYLEVCRSTNLSENIFTGNTANKSGGAIFQLQCPGALSSNTFTQNYASNGGAIWHNNLRSLNHTRNLFVGNVAQKGTGGIELNQVDSMAVTGCNFTASRGVKGGAVYTQNTAGDITDTFFMLNNVTTNGGAIFRGTSSGDITGCAFVNNAAASDGGAIYDSHVSGDITGNNFTLPTSRNNSITGVFRTVSSGNVSNNRGLPDDQLTNQQPATTG